MSRPCKDDDLLLSKGAIQEVCIERREEVDR